MKKLMLAGLVAVLGLAPTFAAAEVQGEKMMIVRRGALEKGTEVIAMYREENGDKILTNLTLGHIGPAPSTPSASPPKRY